MSDPSKCFMAEKQFKLNTHFVQDLNNCFNLGSRDRSLVNSLKSWDGNILGIIQRKNFDYIIGLVRAGFTGFLSTVDTCFRFRVLGGNILGIVWLPVLLLGVCLLRSTGSWCMYEAIRPMISRIWKKKKKKVKKGCRR